MTIIQTFFSIILITFLFFILIVFSALANRFELLRNLWDMPVYTHQLGESSEFMLPMRDGVKLRTLLQKPAGKGPWPAILIRNPYDTLGMDLFNQPCKIFAQYGYACIYQEARGQMQSEGEWEPLVNEPYDTSDTLYWMDKQNWMDGHMAMWGVSYLALTQWAGAMDYPESLKTFLPTSMGTDFHKIVYEKGNFRLFITLWVLLMPDRGVNVKGVLNFWNAAEYFPHNEIDEKFAEKKLNWYQDWIRDVGLNAPTWKREDAIAVKQIAANLDIPVLIYEGWYDPFFSAELQDYQNLATREQSRMVIGPWSHVQMPATSLAVDVDDAIKMSMSATLSWFDYYLKNNHEANAEAYIQTFDLGANQWVKRASWPPVTESLLFEFSNLEQANSCQDGKLIGASFSASNQTEMDVSTAAEHVSENAMNEQVAVLENQTSESLSQVSYYYDPENPVPSRGGSAFLGPLNLKIAPGALTQKGFCEREDVLTFTSDVFEKDSTIAGSVLVQLKVSSDAEDTAFTAKLMDVHPDGTAINIRDTISTLSYRNHSPDPLLYTPNTIVDATLDMWPIEWTLKAGHKLRVDISSSNFPAYNIHSNFAGPWAAQKHVKIARQTLYSGSKVILPVTISD